MDLGAAKEDGNGSKNNGSKGKGSKGKAKKEGTAPVLDAAATSFAPGATEDASDAEGGPTRDDNGSKNAPGGKGARGRRDGERGEGLGVKEVGDVRLRRCPFVCLSYSFSGSAAILCSGGPDVIRKEAWPFCRTISGVRLCWDLEEPKGT